MKPFRSLLGVFFAPLTFGCSSSGNNANDGGTSTADGRVSFFWGAPSEPQRISSEVAR